MRNHQGHCISTLKSKQGSQPSNHSTQPVSALSADLPCNTVLHYFLLLTKEEEVTHIALSDVPFTEWLLGRVILVSSCMLSPMTCLPPCSKELQSTGCQVSRH